LATFVVASFLLAIPANALIEHRIGIKAGANYTWPYPVGPKPDARSFPVGFFAGISVLFEKTNRLSFVSELLLVKGQQYVKYNDCSEFWNNNKFRYYSFEVPFMLRFKCSNSMHLVNGPVLGYLLKATHLPEFKWTYRDNNLTPTNITSGLPNFEVKYAVGIEKEFQCQCCQVSVELRYLIGVTRFRYEEYPWDWTNHSAQAGITFYL
jgi:hypothetical protein